MNDTDETEDVFDPLKNCWSWLIYAAMEIVRLETSSAKEGTKTVQRMSMQYRIEEQTDRAVGIINERETRMVDAAKQLLRIIQQEENTHGED